MLLEIKTGLKNMEFRFIPNNKIVPDILLRRLDIILIKFVFL